MEQGGTAPHALPCFKREVSSNGLSNGLQCHLCSVSHLSPGLSNASQPIQLSIKGTKLSLFTLDGRMHFELTLPETQLLLFKVAKLREISLTRRLDGLFELAFWLETQKALTQQEAQAVLDDQATTQDEVVPAALMSLSPIPDYVSVEVAA